MVTTSILLVIDKVCGYLDNIRYVDIISVADKSKELEFLVALIRSTVFIDGDEGGIDILE